MSKIEFEKNFEIPKVWNATFQLRWYKRMINESSYKNILQQLWISNIGSEEWRDIPQVEN
jgi:hypothetical protein